MKLKTSSATKTEKLPLASPYKAFSEGLLKEESVRTVLKETTNALGDLIYYLEEARTSGVSCVPRETLFNAKQALRKAKNV